MVFDVLLLLWASGVVVGVVSLTRTMYFMNAIVVIVVAWVMDVHLLVFCDCDCHCHCRISFRVLLLLLWSSGCTWREGCHDDKDVDRECVDVVVGPSRDCDCGSAFRCCVLFCMLRLQSPSLNCVLVVVTAVMFWLHLD